MKNIKSSCIKTFLLMHALLDLDTLCILPLFIKNKKVNMFQTEVEKVFT